MESLWSLILAPPPCSQAKQTKVMRNIMYDSLVHAWFGNQGVTVLWIKLLVHIVSVIDSSVGIAQACQKYFIICRWRSPYETTDRNYWKLWLKDILSFGLLEINEWIVDTRYLYTHICMNRHTYVCIVSINIAIITCIFNRTQSTCISRERIQ